MADCYAALITTLSDYFKHSSTLGGEVARQADEFKSAVEKEAFFLEKSATMKKPSDEELPGLLQPISEHMMKVVEIKDKAPRKEANPHHLAAVAEGVNALGWVAVAPTPIPFAKDGLGAAQFWTNRILKDLKDGRASGGEAYATVHKEWVSSFLEFLTQLPVFIKNHHTTGVSWNAASTGGAKPQVAASTGNSSGGSVGDFEQLIADHFTPYVKLSKEFGGKIAEQAAVLEEAVNQELKLLQHVSDTPAKDKPSDDDFPQLLAPISEPMMKVTEIKDTNRGSPEFDHLSCVSEGTATLGWVCVTPAPAPYARDSAGGGVFYGNKVKKNNDKSTDAGAKHHEWVQHINSFFSCMEGYIKQHHMTGLAWGVGGGSGGAGADTAEKGGTESGDLTDLIDEHLNAFIEASSAIGGLVDEQAKLFREAVDEMQKLIKLAASRAKPSDDDFPAILTPLSSKMTAVGDIKEKNRGHAQFNNLTALAEAAPVLGWVCVTPTPAPYAKETVAGVEFWTNKVRQTAKKDNDDVQMKWVEGLLGFLKGLPGYIRNHHTTGLTWGK